jgi:hypothetical protein
MVGIPTVYNGIRFRSMLEARWACVFDSFGWRWEYEPYELAGYIPDFIMDFRPDPVLFEIKPETTLEGLKLHSNKITAAGWDKDVVILGGSSNLRTDYVSRTNPAIGAYGQKDEGGGRTWDYGNLFLCGCCGKYSIVHDSGWYKCLVSGCYDGDSYLCSVSGYEWSQIWASAKNQTQWRKAA